jgi:MFS family permease
MRCRVSSLALYSVIFRGAKVALICVLVETVGLAVIGFASSAVTAAIGAALTGFGYALVFPGLGVEAVRLAPAESRGVAMGAYTACLDIALGVSGPMLGVIASRAGLGAVFLTSSIIVLSAAPVALRLIFSHAPFHDGTEAT